MQAHLTFKKNREVIEKFRGKILIVKGYQSDPEVNFYVGDLIEVNDIDNALGEIESRESDFTQSGKEYIKYAAQNSDIKQILEKNIYRPDYIKDWDDLLAYQPIEFQQNDTPRIFNALKSPKEISTIASDLGIELDVLQPFELRIYDDAFRSIYQQFYSFFREKSRVPSHNFKVGYISPNERILIEADLSKSNYSLNFNPSLYIQKISGKDDKILNSNRATIKIVMHKLQDTSIDYKKKDFLEFTTQFFQEVDEKVCEILLEDHLDVESFLKARQISYFIIPPGKLWEKI